MSTVREGVAFDRTLSPALCIEVTPKCYLSHSNVQFFLITDLTDMFRSCYLIKMTSAKPKKIGFLVFDGIQALDLFGPLDAFQEANDNSVGSTKHYELILVSHDGGSVLTSSGVRIEAHRSIKNCPSLHTLIVAGGEGTRAPDFPADVIQWIKQTAPGLQRYGSICTGLYILAQTGLLNGQTVTTHWRHTEDAQDRFPELKVVPDALYLTTGKVFSAAGVTAGIDLALALIENDLGPSIAADVARHLVVFVKRPGDQRQFSSILQTQMRASDDFADLVAWIANNLRSDLSSFELAERVGLSERQFRRRFANHMGETPTQYIERVRIETASQSLRNERASIEQIALDVGYASSDTFRRAFERFLGVSPTAYRERFGRGAI